ncbi:LOW QUALITY PROTEIN: Fc receptor-like protein 5 [Zonotrichia albicollis]|uniref:LOW QUALITY PROTEIN: Fc receptor-like protein 5 n=1 Tax=Zonotrichia albicollis TaxID=44394 RepID=UPI003D811E6E
MAGKVVLLLWAQTLGLAGAQTTQLLVKPPWRPAVLWDGVTLTCQGSGTAGATTWYKDGKRWWQNGPDHFTVNNTGTYECHRPGSRHSPNLTVSNDGLVLQVPVRALLEGDTVTLRCRGWRNSKVTSVSFYRERKELRGPPDATELSLSPLQLKHSGRYRCKGWVEYPPEKWWWSASVTVRVHELFTVPVLEGPPEITEGSPLTLSCRSTPSPLRPPAPLLYLFYQDGRVLGDPQGSPQLLLPAVGVSRSGNYSCEAQSQGGTVRKSSARLRVTVTVHMPVANATITPGPLAHQVHTGDNVTLRCSVQVGSAPVTFTWLHNGHEVAQGPLLELRDIDVGQSGTYQCKATNQLGQDGHRVFQALSPELALEVTPGSPWWPQGSVGLFCSCSCSWVPYWPGTGGIVWDWKRWRHERQESFTVTDRGSYMCDRPGTGLSPPVAVSEDDLVLQVPVRALLEGDTVTLRCRGWQNRTVTSVSFYRDTKELGRLRDGAELSLSPLQLNHSGSYRCKGWVEYWGRHESAPVTVRVHVLFSVPVLVLVGPPEITEGSPLTLSCRSSPSPLRPPAPLFYLFYQDGRVMGGPQGSPQLLLPAVRVSHSGNYSCEAQSQGGTVRKSSARLSVTVHRVPPSGVSLSAQPPGGQVALGDSLVLSCAVAAGTGPLSFSWHREGSWAPLGTGTRLELGHVGDNDSGQYRCRVSDGDSVAESDTMNVTVLVPVANATITPGPLAHQVHTGDNVTLRCSVQVGSAPVTFTWLHNGQEVARGPLLELRDIDVGHSGTYQCVATNQLGQDGHRVFRAFSPELALEMTPGSPWVTAVAVNVGRALLFLLLLLAVIGGCHWWHRRACEAPRLVPICSPMTLCPSFSLSSEKTRRFSCDFLRAQRLSAPPKDPPSPASCPSSTPQHLLGEPVGVFHKEPVTLAHGQAAQLNHSGRYSCKGCVEYWGWQESAPVTVTVQELFSAPVLVLEGPPEITEGSPLTLSCRSTPSPLRLSSEKTRRFSCDFLRAQRLLAPPKDPPSPAPCPSSTPQHLLGEPVGVSHEEPVTLGHGQAAQTLGLAGAQTTQILVKPPWRPAVLWDPVTLTCQGLGTASATIWYKDGKRWGQKRRDHFTVTVSGTYQCHRPDTGLSPPVTVSDDGLVLQVPVRALLEGDTVTLRCRGRWNRTVTSVSFYHEWTELRGLRDGAELSLSPLQLNHSGRYSCKGSVGSWAWKESAPVTVRVHELFSAPVLVLEGPPEITLGSPLTLSCRSTPSPLRPPAPLLYLFYQDGRVLGRPQGSSQLLLPAVGVSHSGNYSCEAQSQGGTVRKSSAQLRVTVTVHRVPPSGVSLSAQPPGGQVALGDSLVLSCAVAAGTGPLSFSWHREGSGAPLGTGPRLELGHVGDNDSGQYRCRVSDGDSVAESDTMNVTILGERDPRAGDDPTMAPSPSATPVLCPCSARGQCHHHPLSCVHSPHGQCHHHPLSCVPTVPVANATITPGPLAHQVHTGDNVTLRCSVQMGSAPVTFTWLHNGHEVARGPLLELRDIDVGHSGTYQCVATNQLGQDGHRVFRALSPELALEVTPGSPWVTGGVTQGCWGVQDPRGSE